MASKREGTDDSPAVKKPRSAGIPETDDSFAIMPRGIRDLTDDPDSEGPFIWKASYGQRAKLARLLYIREKFKLDKFSIYDSLVKVQYVYHDREPAEFQCIIPVHSYDLSEFLFSVKKHVKGFELKIGNKERWKKIMKVIESANMVHEHDAGWRSRFSNTELLKELPKGDRVYVNLLGNALKSDMAEGKSWLASLFGAFLEDHPELRYDISHHVPSQYAGTSTVMEQLFSTTKATELGLVQTYWELPAHDSDSQSIGSSSESSPRREVDFPDASPELSIWRKRPVPDFALFLDSFPGMFPLVAEVKASRYDGTEQNLEQMLSKLFFQDVIFGLMVTPVKYVLSCIIKEKGMLRFFKTDVNRLTTVADEIDLNMDSLYTFHKFIDSVILWGTKTQCKLNYDST